MIIINKETIEKLNPCEDRFKNYLEHYSEFNGTVEEFLALDKISYDYKVWVLTRLLTKEQTIKWSLLCAKSVLHIFENKYPNDFNPRKALDAVQNWLENPNEKNSVALRSVRIEDYVAAYAAYDATADAAAAYNAYATIATVYYAYTFDAAAADADYAAFEAAVYAASDDREKQKQLNLDFLKQIINEIKNKTQEESP